MKKEKVRFYTNKLKDISHTLESLVWDMIKDLRESEQRYRSIVEFAADAIITIDTDKKVTSWNKGAVNIFGYSEKEAVGQDLDHLIAKNEVIQEAERLSEKVLKGASLRSQEAIRYTKSGLPKNVLISAAPIINESDTVEAVSLMYKDITELKHAHEQLVQTEKQATLGVIAGSIGHELNNVVGGLLIHAKMLQQYYDKPERVKETAELFLLNLEKVVLHGKNLLSLSRPTKPRFENVDINYVLEQTTETLVLSGVLKHIKIIKNLNAKNVHVYGDRNLLEQLIRNLEINAAHAMDDKGELELETRLTSDKKNIEIIFKDNGSGIPEDIQLKIFLPFFTTKSQGLGTGLGLPIVKSIVEQHKGTLKLQSQVGVGTEIIIGMPVVG
jgi:PAS domain S-box-containing protein